MIAFTILMIGLVAGKGVFPVKYPMTDNPVIKDGKRSGEVECKEALRKDPPHCATNYWFYCNTDSQGECLHSCMDFACLSLHPPVWTTPYTTSYPDSSSSSTSLQSPERPNTNLTVPLSALTTPTACNDSPSANCSLYNATVICDLHGAYYLWARKHCPLFCGFCHVVTCNDNPSANCALYNSTAICDVNGQYYNWARRNCEKTCGFCQVGTPQGSTRSTTEVSSFAVPEACRDTLNCKVYNSEKICNKTGIYFPWATTNCPLYCGFCQAPTTTIACQDKLSNCNEYQSNLCTEPLYRLWREENCRKFCGICTGTDSVIDPSSALG
ncbi:uncharacterized protein LOC134242921 isoform X2 [Saccostrea cucullata]|uniref:uncharacterized protein LOC134242921 isoform X2 n=1 Tax=Saccostrea cuccullata TaxID=36930 RepID=UPI002ED47746